MQNSAPNAAINAGQEMDLSARLATIDPSLDLEAEISRLKEEMNAVILAHYYQDEAIQDLADFVGDSLALAQAAAKTNADCIVFCGVHFMAETAKILNPDKPVYLPDLDAGCSLADRCPADVYAEWLKQYPDHIVVNYINSSAAVKALSDVIVTSSNAVDIIRQLPPDKPIVFGPDRHLGRWVEKQTGRKMVLWPGFCIVHEQFNARRLLQLRAEYPEAAIIAHPECEEAVLQQAEFVGSTLALLKYVEKHTEKKQFIVATEAGILHQMKKARPDAEFICSPPNSGCSCALCPYMRLNTLEKLYLCMRDRRPEITIDEETMRRALRPVQRMLEMSQHLSPVKQKGD
ncbi:quinolinate synthetase [Pyrinomonas methylaliphatogenes]|uniref:Quinolinate synthase n=2 Tax=Pyrinomonas methylaliphatogenes TaxID=454194 RepID=A0A0B6X3N8_9BACT|nr:quinolinate synthase NadA [Pyrinomonas methylaliphatogenes]CDM67099.1 quinolinate synthetase [Pyrinomonas methylaliphatogenes]